MRPDGSLANDEFSAIWSFDSPCATSRRTSTSRSVSGSSVSGRTEGRFISLIGFNAMSGWSDI